jgi:hypothetical protein
LTPLAFGAGGPVFQATNVRFNQTDFSVVVWWERRGNATHVHLRRRLANAFGGAKPSLAVFHRLDFGVPARVAPKCALLVVRLVRLNKPKPKRLTTLRARPESEIFVCCSCISWIDRDSLFEGNGYEAADDVRRYPPRRGQFGR